MWLKHNKIFFIILNFFPLCFAENCPDEPMDLDEDFIACCKERPKYASENCTGALLANGTFSSVCLVNCMYREFEIYDGSQIDLAAVDTFLDGQIEDEDFHLAYLNAFETCGVLERDTIKEKFSFIGLTNDHNCDDYPQHIDLCVWYHTLANCPENYATNDESCNERRDWVNGCLLKL